MPPRRRTTAPEPLDIDRLRADLAAGRTVRVAIASSAQFPDGASGRVRGVGDPEVVGPEFVEVEVTVNGVKDVVPFAPADLAPPTARRRPGPADQSGDPAPAPLPAQRIPAAVAPSPALRPLPAAPPPPPLTPERADPTPAAAKPAAARRSTAARPGKAISVTVATSDADPTVWRVEARIGSRVVLKPTPISPARAWDLVQALDNEPLSAAVGAVLEQHRQATQARAQALAAELQALQAELAALPAAGEHAAGD